MKEYTDRELLRLYSEWSEEMWAAGFLIPSADSVKSFIRWLDVGLEPSGEEENKPLEDYELEFLRIYKELS